MKEMPVSQRAEYVARVLADHNPHPKTELSFANEMQLAVAVMLSAQTTDKKVNEITPALFQKYSRWEAFAAADLAELQAAIRGVNFHLGKAERLIAAGRIVTEQFGGTLPHSMSDLMKIPGIARKSANVIMQELWNIAEGIVVDTHVTRVSHRLGLTTETNAVKIEKDLMNLVPKKYWRNFSGTVVLHGRYICRALKPNCAQCLLNNVCPSAFR